MQARQQVFCSHSARFQSAPCLHVAPVAPIFRPPFHLCPPPALFLPPPDHHSTFVLIICFCAQCPSNLLSTLHILPSPCPSTVQRPSALSAYSSFPSCPPSSWSFVCRKKLYSNFGLLYPHGQNELSAAEDFDQIRAAMEKVPAYASIFSKVQAANSARRLKPYTFPAQRSFRNRVGSA